MWTWFLDNIGLKLLSLILAAFLWVVVLGEQKVEVTVNIPLEFNLPQNLTLVNEPPDSLEVHLRGPKTLATSLAPREVVLNSIPSKFAEGENVIGRDPRSSVWVDASGVSRRHARILVSGDAVTLEDLGSKNGTFVGARAVTDSLTPRKLIRVMISSSPSEMATRWGHKTGKAEARAATPGLTASAGPLGPSGVMPISQF